MATVRISSDGTSPKRRPPATTVEKRQQQLIAKAYDLVEKKLEDGTATSQETVHFLKLGTAREQKELRRLDLEARLAEQKLANAEALERADQTYERVIEAMRRYSGNPDNDVIID